MRGGCRHAVDATPGSSGRLELRHFGALQRTSPKCCGSDLLDSDAFDSDGRNSDERVVCPGPSQHLGRRSRTTAFGFVGTPSLAPPLFTGMLWWALSRTGCSGRLITATDMARRICRTALASAIPALPRNAARPSRKCGGGDVSTQSFGNVASAFPLESTAALPICRLGGHDLTTP
jgi:hypothetical protein